MADEWENLAKDSIHFHLSMMDIICDLKEENQKLRKKLCLSTNKENEPTYNIEIETSE